MKQGIRFALLTALISGISIFANGVFVSKVDPLIFAFVRNTIVALLFTIVLLGQSPMQKIRELTSKQWGMLVLVGIVGGGIPFALFFTGLAQIGAVNSNIIQKSLFLWVVLLAVPLLGERIRRVQFLGYALLLLGMFYFGGGVSIVPKLGTWLVLLATVLWSFEQILAKKILTDVSPLIVSWGRMVFGLPLLFLSIVFMGKTGVLVHPSTYAVAPLFVSALLLMAYMVSWYNALAKAPAVVVSCVLVLAPVITAILTRFVLLKPFKDGQILSFSFIVFGVICILSEYRKSHTIDEA